MWVRQHLARYPMRIALVLLVAEDPVLQAFIAPAVAFAIVGDLDSIVIFPVVM